MFYRASRIISRQLFEVQRDLARVVCDAKEITDRLDAVKHQLNAVERLVNTDVHGRLEAVETSMDVINSAIDSLENID